MSGCSRIASTATLSPWTTLKTPSGTPASLSSSADEHRRRRVLLGRLQDERVAARDRRARTSTSGTIAGKLNGVMPGDDAERLADRVDVDAGRGLLGEPALEQVSGSRRRTRGSRARARPRPSASDGTLPCSAVRWAASSLRRLVDEVPDPEQDVGALRERRRAPGRERGLRGGHGGASTSSTEAKSTSRAMRPVAGSKTGPRRPEAPSTIRPPIQWWTAAPIPFASACVGAAPRPGSATCVIVNDLSLLRVRDPGRRSHLTATRIEDPDRSRMRSARVDSSGRSRSGFRPA